MKKLFYPKISWEGMRKNSQIYIPYIFTCIGMVIIIYILNYLKTSDAITALPGGWMISTYMRLGVYVLTFFAVLFLFYTNAFLIRRRKKEFGLYNILGMGRKNIGKILAWETVYTALISLGAGLFGGVVLSKLAELGLINMMKGKVDYSLSVSADGILYTVLSFAVIYLLLLLNALRQVWFTGTASLLKSENVGEKPPKANWLIGLLGFALLGAAYYIAVTIGDPVSALTVFFAAVLMVIGATYMIMISGSILLCHILQRRKKFYYQPKHFVSVSSMAYRMKRNGAGLASICILATMVLVMISSTSALFIGEEAVINKNYPREINLWFHMDENRDVTEEERAHFRETIADVLKKYGTGQENVLDYGFVSIAGVLNNGNVIYDMEALDDFSLSVYSDVASFYMISLEDYNAGMGTDARLEDDEVLIFTNRIEFEGDEFGFYGKRKYKVKEHLKDCFASREVMVNIMSSVIVIVPDLTAASDGLTDSAGNGMTNRKWNYCFDVGLEHDRHSELGKMVIKAFEEDKKVNNTNYHFAVETREGNRADMYSLYGGLFYLGIMLSIVFLFATVLIIYYKQIAEGYEDQSRFEIMQKVGMTKKDIRKSINSQILIVFFLPLAGALAVAALTGCGATASADDKVIKIAASPTPHSEILEKAKPILAEKGYDLQITVFEDYVIPNEVVESGEFTANYIQHLPYLNSFNEEKGTHIVSVGEIHYEPFGIYPGTKKSLSDIAVGDTIAVPNDTTNEARALLLLQDNGIIKLKDGAGLTATVNDIVDNVYGINIKELEAAQVSRVVDEVAYVVLNGNYALEAGYVVSKDALAYEQSDSEAATTYVNIIAVKEGNENNEGVKALVEILKSDEIKKYINDTYEGAVIPFE